jgi:4-cresol dehydrogenase (hydroxylating) flavoprotein subunit
VTAVLDRAVDAFAHALGADAVLTSPEQLGEFRDPYTFAGWAEGAPAAVVSPSSVEEVQVVVRIANELRVPLWTFSQGRNYAYGGAAPKVSGSVLVSLRRMNRVLEVNEELAYALVEPGVRFFDLYEAVRAGGHRLIVSVPVLGWGSVVGNTLEYGWGYTPTGDHASSQCGLEVVLANGDVIRTGTGAMTPSRAWQTYKRSFGPSPDGLFMQSNLGIVTKMGVWLLPEPEIYAPCRVAVPAEEDLEPLMDTLRPLVLDRTIQNVPLVMKDPTSGRWTARFALYGYEAVVDLQLEVVEEAFSGIPGNEVTSRKVAGGTVADADGLDPLDQVMGGVPGMAALEVVKILGGEHGGQLDFSPVTPLTGKDAVRMCDLLKPLYEETGLAFGPGIIVTPRSLVFTSHLTFDTTNEEQVRAAFGLYSRLAEAAGAAGYGVYRTHLEFMDLAAGQYDWGDHALLRFHETLKDALDPNGILSPGKQGIWPQSMRGERP